MRVCCGWNVSLIWRQGPRSFPLALVRLSAVKALTALSHLMPVLLSTLPNLASYFVCSRSCLSVRQGRAKALSPPQRFRGDDCILSPCCSGGTGRFSPFFIPIQRPTALDHSSCTSLSFCLFYGFPQVTFFVPSSPHSPFCGPEFRTSANSYQRPAGPCQRPTGFKGQRWQVPTLAQEQDLLVWCLFWLALDSLLSCPADPRPGAPHVSPP